MAGFDPYQCLVLWEISPTQVAGYLDLTYPSVRRAIDKLVAFIILTTRDDSVFDRKFFTPDIIDAITSDIKEENYIVLIRFKVQNDGDKLCLTTKSPIE